VNNFKPLEVQQWVFSQGVESGRKGGQGERVEGPGVITCKKSATKSAKNSFLRQNGEFVILDFESFTNMKFTFVR